MTMKNSLAFAVYLLIHAAVGDLLLDGQKIATISDADNAINFKHVFDLHPEQILRISMSNETLEDPDYDELYKFSMLQVLEIRDMLSCPRIDGDFFDRLQHLRKLIVKASDDVYGVEFEEDAFANATSLEYLEIERLPLIFYLSDEFLNDGLQNLTYLSLDDGFIRDIENGTFVNVPDLKVLSLQDNKLTNLQPGVFQDLKNLKSLLLNGNILEDFSWDIFDGLDELKYLSLSEVHPKEINLKKIREVLPEVSTITIFVSSCLLDEDEDACAKETPGYDEIDGIYKDDFLNVVFIDSDGRIC